MARGSSARVLIGTGVTCWLITLFLVMQYAAGLGGDTNRLEPEENGFPPLWDICVI